MKGRILMNLIVRRLSFSIFVLILSMHLCFADARNWIGGTSTNWGTASNCSGNVLPGAGDDVAISGGAFAPNLSSSIYTIHSLTVKITLTVSGGTLYIIGGSSNINSSCTQSGGSVYSDHNFVLKPNTIAGANVSPMQLPIFIHAFYEMECFGTGNDV